MDEGGGKFDQLFQKGADWLANKIAPGGFPTIPSEQLFTEHRTQQGDTVFPTLIDKNTWIPPDRLERIHTSQQLIESHESNSRANGWLEKVIALIPNFTESKVIDLEMRHQLNLPPKENRPRSRNMSDTMLISSAKESSILSKWEEITSTAKMVLANMRSDARKLKYPESAKSAIKILERVKRKSDENHRILTSQAKLAFENPSKDLAPVIIRGPRGLYEFLSTGRHSPTLDRENTNFASFTDETKIVLTKATTNPIRHFRSIPDGPAQRFQTELEMGIHTMSGEEKSDPHPNYGMLTTISRAITHPESLALTGYGEAVVILNNTTLDRSTFTIGDSENNNSTGEPYKQLMQEHALKVASVMETIISSPHVDQAEVAGNHTTSYIETQILGGLTMSDVVSIVIPRKPDYEPTIQLAQKLNIFDEVIINGYSIFSPKTTT